MPRLLENYQQLIARVDALCQTIAVALGGQITCSAGCSSCCTSITVFPVEAAAMREALNKLPAQRADEIRRHVLENADGERCPLLFQHQCLLYEARPIICRTHGLPIIYTSEGQRNSDCCPLNLTGTESPLSGTSVVDLDKLNTLLVAINSIYLSQAESSETEVRVTIAEALKRM
ncbi:MAG: YkgJ family cysteine cluster protein [Geobacteraceae bacterium]|nr:YkgJ family cysteine cluster protein [Geobacteraceae bacterium]NTW80911.1 YkgJ family cysteine cluster protein [Geobacteraceae bacterium]